MKRIIKKILNIIKKWKLRLLNDDYIELGVNLLHSKIGENVILSKNSNVTWSRIGKYTYLGENTYLPYCKIGKFCSIAPEVRMAAGLHPKNYVSTHPLFYNQYLKRGKIKESNIHFETFERIEGEDKILCEIGNDVWISTNVLLVCGRKPLHIGNGAIIAAGAVVTKDVPPYSIVMGVPAKVVDYRFDKNIIKEINDLAWWDRSDEWIEKYINMFDKPDDFIKFAK